MWLWMWVAVAFGGTWDGKSGDVVAQRDIAVAPEILFPLTADLAVFQLIFPADCATDWILGATSSGSGARATVRYDIAGVRRKLSAVITVATASRLVDIDHEGKKGFITRFELVPNVAGGTHVTMSTFLNPPPKPFQGIYFKKVQPAWNICQVKALDALAAKAGAP